MTADRVNKFALKIATVNGTGSASANGMLMQAIFRMGIPVSGKNVFPSNIQGLPTWYEIRVDRDGHTGRCADFDLMIAMNAETYERDIEEVREGGYLIYDSTWPLSPDLLGREISYLGIPLSEMCNERFKGSRERILMKNIAYVGALVALCNLDWDVIQGMLKEKFSKKPHLMDSNFAAIQLGYDYAKEHFSCPLPIHLESMNGTANHIMIDGNSAAALGCVYAGATVGAWYPITPSTSLMDSFARYCGQLRVDRETGKKNYMIIQAEDELAAIGMVLGASWNGARAFTPTSGPGISLMNEFIGLAYYAEIPAVLFDVQRTGPSTGMPTRTQQADLFECAYASHGDTQHILLFPANPEECFYLSAQAFDLAERFQTPVFVVIDLDIGMNDWMCPDLKWDDSYEPDRGKVLTAEQLAGMERFHRYLDEDGDGICARTLPGVHPNGAYFVRGSGHNRFGGYTEDADEYQDVVDRIKRKFETARHALPAPEIVAGENNAGSEGSRLGIVTMGGCRSSTLEGIEQLAEEGISADFMRIRGFPFSPEVTRFLESHQTNIVIEQNRDAQLKRLLLLETPIAKDRLESILSYGGFPLSAREVVDGVKRVIEREDSRELYQKTGSHPSRIAEKSAGPNPS